MARSVNRKRHRSDEALHDDRPAKARKTDSSSRNEPSAKTPRDNSPAQSINPPPPAEDHRPWKYPPEFWDRLSRIPLIRTALEELDRRTWTSTCTRPVFPPPPTRLAQDLAPTTTRELARFARHGGPDLRDIRGYPAASNPQPVNAMSSSSQSRATKSTDPTTVPVTSATTKTRKSTTPYNPGFEQHLTDHAIHADWRSQEPDLEEIQAALAVPRPSLSPPRFPNSAFKTFRQSNAQAKDEEDVKVYVVPTITGAKQPDHPSAINTKFANLEPLTDGTIAPAQPDMYYGAYPEQLDPSVREELSRHIIPSTMTDKPMAPNFFLEYKGPYGSLAVANRQARYDGAVGTRAIHSLQNYGANEPVYDGKAYTFSSTYHGGTLKMYAHHVTVEEGRRPEYHMTMLRGFDMTDSRETFVQGATAFRNARDLAKQYRDTFIQAANTAGAREEFPVAAERGVDDDPGSDRGPPADNRDQQDDQRDHFRTSESLGAAQEEPPVTAESVVDDDSSSDGGPPADNLDQRDDQQDHSPTSELLGAAVEHATSFATSFTPSLTSGNGPHRSGAPSKRPRTSQSPPSDSHRSKKHGKTPSQGEANTGK